MTTYSGWSASIAAAMCAQSPRARARCDADALADGGYVLAGEPADEDVHGFDLTPVDGRDVAEVRWVGPVVREDAGDGLVEFGEPRGLGVENVLDGEVEAAVAAEQRPDPESWFAADVEVVHKVCSGEGRPRHPCLVEH